MNDGTVLSISQMSYNLHLIINYDYMTFTWTILFSQKYKYYSTPTN